MENRHECANVHPCTCPNVNCKNYGKCCSCVANHRKMGNPPNCYKFPEPDDNDKRNVTITTILNG